MKFLALTKNYYGFGNEQNTAVANVKMSLPDAGEPDSVEIRVLRVPDDATYSRQTYISTKRMDEVEHVDTVKVPNKRYEE